MEKGSKMDSPVGIYSTKSNPLAQPKITPSDFGPGMNPDQRIAESLRKKAYAERDSLRGKSGM